MKHDGVTAVTLMALAAFAVERVTTAVLFLLASSKGVKTWLDVERHQKLAYFSLAGLLVLVVLLINPELRVLTVLNVQSSDALDIGLTWLVLVAGSDRLGTLIKGSPAVPEQEDKPIQVKGSLLLVNDKDAA